MEVAMELMPYLQGILEKKKNCSISLYKKDEDFIVKIRSGFKKTVLKSPTSIFLIMGLKEYLNKQ